MKPYALLATVLLLAPVSSALAQDSAPPDVLFISIDDLNDWVGVLGGHPQAITPNIDALAARGMLFTNAHAPSALCNPSRTAIFTGLAPSTTGIYGNAPDWRTVDRLNGIPTIPKYFHERGYRTFGAGPHFCIGVHQARMILEIITEEIARRMSNMRFLSEPVHFRSNFMDGFKKMHIAFDKAAQAR